ncbi:hypothetical protein FBZ83_107332 [Azospirillum brasilense]|uniref:Uncharacterized protein n=1 Tax=Azospirillum brasilense TaxID=192 RepID=A0A560CCQ3_AZOBR|nr:hypothetical protein [Azospirillum brasilense]TWA82638.1 hypothetical protein FBZ83_107332 [Azospirillum brasilense]
MPYDFRSQDQRTADSGRTPGTPIGFHELRQACEISALREDLERVLQDTGALRDSIEDAVEQVRQRFAALTAEELANSETMAPLLQFAVSTLLTIRDEARRINTQTGPVDDDDRPTRTVADPRPPPSAGTPAAPPSVPPPPSPQTAPQTAPQTYAPPPSDEPAPSFASEPEREETSPPPTRAPVLSPFVPRAPAPAPQRPAAPDPAPEAPPAPSWLSPLSGRKGGPGVNGSAPRNGNVDWLSRPKR